MGGFVKMAREFDGVELVGIESPLWPKTYMGSGWVTEEAFETLTGKMIEGLKAEGPFDGVYLSLHGAMAVRGVRASRGRAGAPGARGGRTESRHRRDLRPARQ